MRIKNYEELNKINLGKNAAKKISSILLSTEEKKSKYSNKKVKRIVNQKEVIFDSNKEAKYFDNLCLELKAGKIQELNLQPEFEIIPQIKYEGKTYCKIKYIADFSYIKNGILHVVDVKGFKTDVYQIKKRLFLLNNPGVKFIEG